MNLGSLITVVATGASNLSVVVLDNGIYEVTGGQKIAARAAQVDYVALASSLGFRSAFGHHEEATWRQQAAEVMASPGPRLVSLSVDRAAPADMATSLPPISERLTKLSTAVSSFA